MSSSSGSPELELEEEESDSFYSSSSRWTGRTGRADHNMGGQSEEGILRAKAQRVAKPDIDGYEEDRLSSYHNTRRCFNILF